MKLEFIKQNLFGKTVYSISNSKTIKKGYIEVSISKFGKKWRVLKTDGNFAIEQVKVFNTLKEAKKYSLAFLTK